MDSYLTNKIGINTYVLLSSIVLFSALVAYISRRAPRAPKLTGIPRMTGYGTNHERAIMDGSLMHQASPFVLETKTPLVVLPMCVMDEIKNIAQSKATFHEAQKKDMLAEFTGIFQHNIQMAETVKFDLNRHLASTLQEVEEEVGWVYEREFGNPDDWQTYPLYHKLVHIVARLTSGVFVGPRLTRDDEWTETLLGLTVNLLAARDAIKRWPRFIQPVVGHFLPEVRRLNRHIASLTKWLAPIIDKSVLDDPEKHAQAPNNNEMKLNIEAEDEEHEGSFMSWILKRMKTIKPLALARAQVSLSFASIHTSTNALTFMFLDLATKPEYTQPLRDEIEEVIKEDEVEEDEHGALKFKQSTLAKLKKLDSFMKESSRLSKSPITMLRQTLEPITLSTGHTIPRGARMAFNAGFVHNSTGTRTFSPEYNPVENKHPSEFDGFRFYKLRQIEGNENKHSFATSSPDSLTWGYGNHACPGRFFAANELKVILVEFIRNWDFKVADPERTNTESMRNMFELFLVPPQQAEIQMRRRKKV